MEQVAYTPAPAKTGSKGAQIALLYESGLSTRQVAKSMNICSSSVHAHLKKQNIKRRTIRRYTLDSSYFDNIDSHEKAQILGFIAADGCIVESGIGKRRKTLTIAIHKQDREYLEKIKEAIGYQGPIREIPDKNQIVLGITSVALCSGLMKAGIGPRKSLTLTFPNKEQLPRELASSYVLGYFEGDGCITSYRKTGSYVPQYRATFILTQDMGQHIKEILDNLGINSWFAKVKYEGSENKNVHTLVVGGNSKVKKLMAHLYKDAHFVMERKYERYLKLLSMFDANDKLIKNK